MSISDDIIDFPKTRNALIIIDIRGIMVKTGNLNNHELQKIYRISLPSFPANKFDLFRRFFNNPSNIACLVYPNLSASKQLLFRTFSFS